MTALRKRMLEELQRRNYSKETSAKAGRPPQPRPQQEQQSSAAAKVASDSINIGVG